MPTSSSPTTCTRTSRSQRRRRRVATLLGDDGVLHVEARTSSSSSTGAVRHDLPRAPVLLLGCSRSSRCSNGTDSTSSTSSGSRRTAAVSHLGRIDGCGASGAGRAGGPRCRAGSRPRSAAGLQRFAPRVATVTDSAPDFLNAEGRRSDRGGLRSRREGEHAAQRHRRRRGGHSVRRRPQSPSRAATSPDPIFRSSLRRRWRISGPTRC